MKKPPGKAKKGLGKRRAVSDGAPARPEDANRISGLCRRLGAAADDFASGAGQFVSEKVKSVSRSN